MTMAALIAALNARGADLAAQAAGRAQAAVIAAVPPGVEATAVPDGVQLTAPALRARARGTRAAAADPQLFALADAAREAAR